MKFKKERIQTFKKSPHHHTPGKHKVATAECKTFAKMKRFVGNITGNDSKDVVMAKLKVSTAAGAKMGNEIVVGFNSIIKLIEKDNAAVVCIAKDAHINITNCLIEACDAGNVPFVILPNISEPMKSIFNIKSVTCFALKKTFDNSGKPVKEVQVSNDTSMESSESAATEGKNDEEADVDAEVKTLARQASIDALRELILSLIKK